MRTIQVGEFKSNLSFILEMVQNKNETFVIEFGKKRKKIAMLTPYKKSKKMRKFGQLRGKLDIPDNFDDENEEINDMFYGSRI